MSQAHRGHRPRAAHPSSPAADGTAVAMRPGHRAEHHPDASSTWSTSPASPPARPPAGPARPRHHADVRLPARRRRVRGGQFQWPWRRRGDGGRPRPGPGPLVPRPSGPPAGGAQRRYPCRGGRLFAGQPDRRRLRQPPRLPARARSRCQWPCHPPDLRRGVTPPVPPAPVAAGGAAYPGAGRGFRREVATPAPYDVGAVTAPVTRLAAR